jgi:NADH-quinone oxidoreductase subunit E
MDQEKFDGILSRYEGEASDLIAVLQDIQDQYSYLPKDELKVVAARLDVPLTRIYSVATFYKMFSLVPKGKNQIKVCLGTTCHLRGGPRLVESIGHRLGVEPGYTTKDMQFSLETVGCLGSCAQAPVMMIGDRYFGRCGVDKVPKILKQYK